MVQNPLDTNNPFEPICLDPQMTPWTFDNPNGIHTGQTHTCIFSFCEIKSLTMKLLQYKFYFFYNVAFRTVFD